MTHAYSELYVKEAMRTLAETFDYVRGGEQADMLFTDFIESGVAEQFGRGEPLYVDMPPQTLYEKITGMRAPRKHEAQFERSPEYWCGYVLAYYQWYSGLDFGRIGRELPPSKILGMYLSFHASDLGSFVEIANTIVYHRETNLKQYRRNAHLSQLKLARLSDVSVRSIQLYEQKRSDINMAPAIKLFRISKVLGCTIEDLLEINH